MDNERVLSAELTAELQQTLYQLAEATGRPVNLLIAEMLEGLREQKDAQKTNGEANGTVLDLFRPSWDRIDEKALDDLPTDLAAQHDHYIYGTPIAQEGFQVMF